MHQWAKQVVAMSSVAAVAFGLGGSFAGKRAIREITAAVADTEAINEVSRVQSWDRVEHLLDEGCTKEALEQVRIQQSLALLALKMQFQVAGDKGLMAKLRASHPDIAKRAESASIGKTSTSPTCK